ncbi:phage-like element PBSX protein XkdS [Paenibacillus sp. FSL R7-269]|uniref:DUF2634 domain-containing protein n=1 Tax=Paenibacillus sp. FSL R7-269 TaxID=1226755 RepID=UPI0003E22999|nr:DUF2634 domain-containing protein [Paenibacillus sp. FSL R7-269]ETT45699.1 phage-like element PBSX protein XkdS [Paenibacillus sp. FSL R7-269]
MADDSLFPVLDLTDLDGIELTESVVSATKWTYVIDYRNRRAVFDDAGHPTKTRTYPEYLVQTALKILNTERFRYVVYGEGIGVERSEWYGWEDVEIKRDMEEALMAHAEIQRAEVRSMHRSGQEMLLNISLSGLAGNAELEEAIST